MRRQVNPNELHHNALCNEVAVFPVPFYFFRPIFQSEPRSQMAVTLFICLHVRKSHPSIRVVLFLMWGK